ncbi:helix-turn-helix transcriptional regulator [Nocardia elegans]|uniref:Helix-turn-helix domain-containing protein n=1 Tax=Nocardia elegans TaxID=300029 RepID=A0ABW6T8H9_9NOCA|nr:AraC family transcriptional regulator [Nocardia elegans]MBF6448853.1 helix-turn-helix transcriptional regulator [Nocardia elegans]
MSGVSAGARRLPAPSLRPYLGRYDGYLLRGFDPGVHVGMPSTSITVILTIDEPIDVPVSSHPDQAGGRWDALAGGLTLRPTLIAHNGYQHGIQLAVTPLGARALFGIPAGELGEWIVDLSDLLGPEAERLRGRIAATSDWRARFAVLDEVFCARVAAIDARRLEMDANLRRAWRLLTDPAGAPTVDRVAHEIGWSRRHLAARFAGEFGITPKEAARLTRFEVSHRMVRRPEVSIAEVAAVTGYYDQAHMAREWRELAGCPPSAWRAREVFPFVQDDGGPGEKGWVHDRNNRYRNDPYRDDDRPAVADVHLP